MLGLVKKPHPYDGHDDTLSSATATILAVTRKEALRWSPSRFRAAMAVGIDGKRLPFKRLHKMLARYVPKEDLPAQATLWTFSKEGSKGPQGYVVGVIAHLLDLDVEDLLEPVELLNELPERGAHKDDDEQKRGRKKRAS